MWASRFNKKSGEFRSTSKVQQKHKELKWLMMNSDQHRRFNSKMIKDWPTSQTKAPGSRSMRNCFTLGQGRYRESEKFAEIWKEKKWNHWEVCRNLKKKTKIEIIEKFAEIWKDKDRNHWEVCRNLKRQRLKSLSGWEQIHCMVFQADTAKGENSVKNEFDLFFWKQLPYS